MVDNTSTDSNSGPTIIFKKKLYFHLVLPCEDAFHKKFINPGLTNHDTNYWKILECRKSLDSTQTKPVNINVDRNADRNIEGTQSDHCWNTHGAEDRTFTEPKTELHGTEDRTDTEPKTEHTWNRRQNCMEPKTEQARSRRQNIHGNMLGTLNESLEVNFFAISVYLVINETILQIRFVSPMIRSNWRPREAGLSMQLLHILEEKLSHEDKYLHNLKRFTPMLGYFIKVCTMFFDSHFPHPHTCILLQYPQKILKACLLGQGSGSPFPPKVASSGCFSPSKISKPTF